MGGLKVRGLWCGADEAGFTAQSVDEYVGRMHDAGFNLILPGLKQGHGRVAWPSEKFPDRVAEGYKEFDLPKHLLEACRKRDMEVHAWFIDFMDSPDHPRPEWAMRDRNGDPTDSETLRGKKYRARWMCPAQRPGYTDQQLIPMYREFAERYAFDAVHHDYIRYPGDLAPDQYCFCDCCLEQIPRWARLVMDAMPERAFEHPMYDRGYLEAHWEPSPRVLPADWSEMTRQEKSDFLLEGSFFKEGRKDLDHFFYEYRMHWINEFARECATAVRDARPGMKISAAVFKNPIHSGRFIGQDWRQHAAFVDVAMPMDYRDHFPGSFDDYLVLFGETIEEQKTWTRDFKEYYPGCAINFMFWEEELPLQALALAAELGDKANACGFFHSVTARLASTDSELKDEIAQWVGAGKASGGRGDLTDHPCEQSSELARSKPPDGAGAMPELAPATHRGVDAQWVGNGRASDLDDAQRYLSHKRDEFFEIDEQQTPQFAKRLREFADDPPKSYWPKEKLERLVETVERSGVDGMVIFSEGHLHKYGLWETARSLFA